MSKLLIVIPAHNEEANIVQVVEELTRGYPQYDYVVVNDGSRDKTAALCRAHGYRLIDLPVNLGLAGAFQTGLRFAAENGYDCAMQMDADGQHKPEYIAPMLAALEEGNDIVIGSRFLAVKKPKTLRMLGSYIISWSIRLTTGRAICDPTSGMRMFNRAMVEEFAQNLNYGPEPDTISYLIKNGATVKEVQVEMGERLAGQSYLTFWRSVQYMVKMSISILLIQWFRKRDTETPYPERSLGNVRSNADSCLPDPGQLHHGGVHPAARAARKGPDRGYDLLAAVQRRFADFSHLPRHRLLGRQPAGLHEPHQLCVCGHHLFAAGQAVLYVHQIEPARQQGPYPDRAGRPERGKGGAG